MKSSSTRAVNAPCSSWTTTARLVPSCRTQIKRTCLKDLEQSVSFIGGIIRSEGVIALCYVVRQLSQKFTTAIVTGRGKEKVKEFVKLDNLFYAGRYGRKLTMLGDRLM